MHCRIIRKLVHLKKTYPTYQLSCAISTKEPTSATATAPQVQPSFEENTEELRSSRWQNRNTKYSVEALPVHTCLTKEETQVEIARSIMKFNPELEKLDTLPKHEWRGFLQLLGQYKGFDYKSLLTMQTLLGGKGTSRKQLMLDAQHEGIVKDQNFMPERVNALGPDLAAAFFAVYRGGRVRFHGKDEWFMLDKYNECEMPRKEVPGWNLKEIDASKMTLLYNGLDNFANCSSLESINLSGNKSVDNFFIDRICYHHSDSLLSLDISKCPLLSIGGITALVRLRKLKRLVLTGLDIPHLALACLYLEEELPGLEIIGVEFEGSEISEADIKEVDEALLCDKISLGK